MEKNNHQEQFFRDFARAFGYYVHMRKLILVCGPAAIGKSTWSKNYITAHPEETVFILAADEVRKEMFGGYDKFPPNKNMMVVYEEMVEIAHRLAKENENLTLIIDTTMLYDERRLYFKRHLPEFDTMVLALLKLHDYTKCLERNRLRPQEKCVPEEVIVNMWNHYMDPSPSTAEHFSEVLDIYVD